MPPRMAQAATDPDAALQDPSTPANLQAQNAALSAYNLATRQYNDAFQQLTTLQGTARPADDSAGKQWDADYRAAADAVAGAKQQAATASRQYATILQDQAKQASADNSAAGQAKAQEASARAELVGAQADGYAARTSAQQDNAKARLVAAQAALERATTPKNAQTIQTANGIYTKDDVANPSPDGSPGWRLAKDDRGNALPGTRDPAQQALTTAQGQLTQAQADILKRKAGPEIAQAIAQGNLTQAQADAYAATSAADIQAKVASTANTQATTARTQALLPGEVASQQASIAQLQAAAAQGDANAKKTLQEIALANIPKYGEATPTSGPLQTVTDPTTGQQTTRPNPNAPIADVDAQAQQLRLQAQAKHDELQKQVLNGSLDQAAAQQQFNDFWNTAVEPQRQALAAAQRVQQQQDFTNQVAARSSQNQSDQLQSTTASNLATSQQNGATLGSNLLQKRAELANTSAQNVLGIATGSKNFGIGGGPVPDVSNLFNAATQQATQQLGGQGTMDAAQRLVQSIDPTNKTGFAAHAYAALSQVMDRMQGQQPLQAPPPPDTTSMLSQSTYRFGGGDSQVPSGGDPASVAAAAAHGAVSAALGNPLGAAPATPALPAIPAYGPARVSMNA